MKEIELSKGGKNKGKYFAMVDDDKFDYLNQFNWWVKFSNTTMYAVRSTWVDGAHGKKIYMHRDVMGIDDTSIHIDHINHNGFDNRVENLRTCTRSENQKNRRGSGQSKYLGVHIANLKSNYTRKDGTINQKIYSKWSAKIKLDGKTKYIGIFETELEAAKAYDKFAKEIHGAFANLNFKEEVPTEMIGT